MNYLRKVPSALGGIFLAALLIAALAPKATRAIAAALVQVVNTPANPVVTTDSLGTATLLQLECQATSAFGSTGNFESVCVTVGSFTVPDGKRAIVENVDGNCFAPVGATIAAVQLFVTPPLVAHSLPLLFQGSAFGSNHYAYNFPFRLYADPGQQFVLNILTNDATGSSSCTALITGRLVPTS